MCIIIDRFFFCVLFNLNPEYTEIFFYYLLKKHIKMLTLASIELDKSIVQLPI